MKKNYEKKTPVKDALIIGALGIGVTYVSGWIARGVKHAITETKWWQEKAHPTIEENYNKFEDWRDDQIDKISKVFKKKN